MPNKKQYEIKRQNLIIWLFFGRAIRLQVDGWKKKMISSQDKIFQPSNLFRGFELNAAHIVSFVKLVLATQYIVRRKRKKVLLRRSWKSEPMIVKIISTFGLSEKRFKNFLTSSENWIAKNCSSFWIILSPGQLLVFYINWLLSYVRTKNQSRQFILSENWKKSAKSNFCWKLLSHI